MDRSSNGNGRSRQADNDLPEPHGRAALLLVESLIHTLASRSVISVAEAIEVIEVAAEVEQEAAHLSGSAPGAPSLLVPLAKSMRNDLEG